ncbi:MAG: ABC transporter permease subunit [Acidobacteriota bacterium]|nr:MAG: ABC transporter permease subunit [Acidobacteriota bacterium]
MIRPAVVLTLARAELRSMLRLVRYWVFAALSLLIGSVGYAYYTSLHWFFSSWSPTVGAASPRFLIGLFGQFYLLVYMLGIVFLAFDVRARDERERIGEVLDSRPYSNVELLVGRWLGILAASWLPVLVYVVLLAIVGPILRESVHPVSLIDFGVFMTLPAFSFTIGLVFLISLIVRRRLLAAVVSVGLLIGWIVWVWRQPAYIAGAFNIPGSFALGFPSDLTGAGSTLLDALQRAGYFVVGLALTLLAAALHPRPDDGARSIRAAAGALVAVAGISLIAGTPMRDARHLRMLEHWEQAHEERKTDPVPDITRIHGEAILEPGRTLTLHLTIAFRAPREAALERALFTLNPGLEIASLTQAGAGPLEYGFENGLLDVALATPLAAGESAAIDLEAHGLPDDRFAYLDAAAQPLSVDNRDGAIFMLGYIASAFRSDFVALMPGLRWLPASGSDVGRSDPSVRTTDFFELDLSVDLPQGWLAAGPGRRREQGGADAGRSRVRFAPGAPLPEAALIAGRYTSRAVEIEGVLFEVLHGASHERNYDYFADAAGEIQDWLGERLRAAAELGLAYPYDALTMVEVPTWLRGFGGGWRLDTALGPPAMVLVRENSFPLTHFGGPFWTVDEAEEKEGGIPRAKREAVERFFENDFSGGNPFIAAARNFFLHQTEARGKAGLALNFMFETLATELVAGKQGYFSAHLFNRDLGPVIQRSVETAFSQDESNWAQAVVNAATSGVAVWDTVLDVSLTELEPQQDPRRTLDVLTLKSAAMGRSLRDQLGRRRMAMLLAALREHYSGQTFSREDLIATAAELGEDLAEPLAIWLDQTALPGIVATHADAYRLPDEEDGTARYQTKLALANPEPAPGVFTVQATWRTGEDSGEVNSEPIVIPARSAIEVGLVSPQPPRVVLLTPYLSLNRGPFEVDLPAVAEDAITSGEAFTGARPIEWTPASEEAIVVDDLDEGFLVEQAEAGSWFRRGGQGSSTETDQGLPVALFGMRATSWSRIARPSFHGRYRHTAAITSSGPEGSLAVFRAELPERAAWQLELFVPAYYARDARLLKKRRWQLEIGTESKSVSEAFDSDVGEPGWHLVGEYDVGPGPVDVALSAKTDGTLVVADAIRWRRAPSVESSE